MPQISNKYDYIIAGAGSSGLSLAWHLIHSGIEKKKILVVDKTLSPANDKTWCFWEKDVPPFKHLIHKKWIQSEIMVDGDYSQEKLDLYPYYSIRSGKYRSAILSELDNHPDATLLESPIIELTGDESHAELKCEQGRYEAKFIFQSCFKPTLKRSAAYPLVQHFLGWEVTTAHDVFDPDSFVLMDFDSTYQPGIAFMYVLPWTSQKALLEYTIFSKYTEQMETYEKKLELYLNNRYGMNPIKYKIERKEYGNIPMNDAVPNPWFAPRVLNIGTQAGLTKPSTGYTFRRIQQHSRKIVEALANHEKPEPGHQSERRYRYYDLWLLQIIHDHPKEAKEVFKQLFKNNSLDEIFRFLGEESTLGQDLKIMRSVPWWPFFRAIWKTKHALFSY